MGLSRRAAGWVLLVSVVLVAHGSMELELLQEFSDRVCTVSADTAIPTDQTKYPIATGGLQFGGKATLNECMNSCVTNAECVEARFDEGSQRCYRAKESSHNQQSMSELLLGEGKDEEQAQEEDNKNAEDDENAPENQAQDDQEPPADGLAAPDQGASTAMMCESAPNVKRSKVCKTARTGSTQTANKEDQLDLKGVKYGAKTDRVSCLRGCSLSSDCMEATWVPATGNCYPSMQPVVQDLFHAQVNFLIQCVQLSDEEVIAAENLNANKTAIEELNREVNGTKTDELPAAEAAKAQANAKVDKAKIQKKAAEDKLKELEQEKKDTQEELGDEQKQKSKAKARLEKLEAKEEVAKEKAEGAVSQKEKKLAAMAEAKAAERKKKAEEEEQRLKVQEIQLKIEQKKAVSAEAMAMVNLHKMNLKVRTAKLAKEKRQKNDKWYKKGHVLFAQGVKYQSLLEKLSESNNKLDAYHYKEELGTYTKAFPEGFTAPLSKKDGFVGNLEP